MARRRKVEKVTRVRTCDVREGVTVGQAKRFWDRPGPGQTSRRRVTKLGTDWEQRGRQVVMYDFDDNRTTFKCEGGRIQAYTDYAEDVPGLVRARRRAKRRR